MEITTSEMQQRLVDESREKLLENAKYMRDHGLKDTEIRRMVQAHVKTKMRQFYSQRKDFSTIGDCIGEAASEMSGIKDRTSKAEMIFHEMLTESGVKFQFQYRIGPYRADYLVGDNLVVELDGPHHKRAESVKHDLVRDAYMIEKGFAILRLDLDVVAMDPKAAIEGIKELWTRSN
jgi:very-short-patch-repair endonuclease